MLIIHINPIIIQQTQGMLLIDSNSNKMHRNNFLRHLIPPSKVMQSNCYYCQSHDKQQSISIDDKNVSKEGGTYRRFAEYAWEKILQSGLVSEQTDAIPKELVQNSSPAKGLPEGSVVNIELRYAAAQRMGKRSPLRLARYALLETLTPSRGSTMDMVVEAEKGSGKVERTSFLSVPQGIQVLNLVLFPDVSLPLPVLGMDLVTLPGGKNLIAIDFQPILPVDTVEDESLRLFPEKYEPFREKLCALHQRHVLDQKHVMPWGGDLPAPAKRFFSPYALWTRIQDTQLEKGMRDSQSIIEKEVFDAFCAYFDLYLEMMSVAALDDDVEQQPNRSVWQGHVDYLSYRRANDPARPMLTRLYGKEYAETVIGEILFEMISDLSG
jgi:phycoerythrobilin:ferredoxin oxidoreductase